MSGPTTKYQITAPDGSEYEIEGPADATDDQVIAITQDYLAKQGKGPSKTAVTRAAPKGVGEQALDSVRNVGAGLVEGAGALIDIPVNALGALLGKGADLIGLPDYVGKNLSNPITFGRMGKGIAAPQPDDASVSIQRALAQGIGGAAGGVGIGNLLAKIGGPLASGFGQQLAQQPVTQAAAGAVGATAAEGARLGGAPIPVQVASGIIAGGAAPSTLRATGGAVEAGVNRIITDEGIRQAASRMIQENASNPLGRLLEMIDAAPVVQRSGASPTLAEVTLDPGIAGLQRALGNSTVTGGARISSQQADNAIARGRYANEALGPGDPRALTTSAEARGRLLERRSGMAREAVGPDIAPEAVGEQVRARLVEGLQGAKARTSAAYDAPVLQEDVPVRLRPIDVEDVTLPSPPVQKSALADQVETVLQQTKGRLPDRPTTLMQFVRARGGINPDGMGAGDLRSAGMDYRGQPGLINRNGQDLDKMREAAVEAGYLREDSTIDDMIQAMSDEYNQGTPTYAGADMTDVVAYDDALAARDFWREEFDNRGLDPLKMSDDQWSKFFDDVNGTSAGNADKSVGPNDVTAPKQGQVNGPFQNTIMALRDRYFGDGGAEAPAYMRAFFDDVLNADEVGLKTLEGWERRAADMAGRAPDKTTAAFMQSVGRAIGAKAAQEAGPARRAALQAARGARREQGETYETGTVGKALQRENYGRFAVPDAAVGGTVVPKGRTGGQAVEQLARAGGADTAETALRAEVRRALTDAGTDPRAVSRVALTYRDAIRQVPAVAASIRDARAAAVLQQRFERSTFGRLRGEDGKDPNRAVARLITADDAGRSLRRFGEDISDSPVALNGMRRSIANWIADSSKTTAVQDDLQAVPSTPKMIGAIEKVLKTTHGSAILNSDQRAVLNALRRELRQDQFAKSANKTSGSDTARNVDANLGMLKLASMIPGGDKAKTVLEVVLKVAGRTDMLRDTLAEAMADPKFAATLLREQHPQRLENALRRIRSLNTGAATGSAASTSQDRRLEKAPADPQ